MAFTEEDEKQGILIGEIVEKVTQRASSEPSEDIRMVFMSKYGNFKGYSCQVKFGVSLCCESVPCGVIKPSVQNVFSTLKITSRTYSLLNKLLE